MIGAATSGVAHGVTMNNKIPWLLLVLATFAAIVAVAGWHHARAQLHEVRANQLQPVVAFLKENHQLLRSLQSESALEKDSEILAAYLAKIRADGVAKHADMKQQLDRLAENNSSILALVNVYKPRAKTAAFNAEAEKFQRYAVAWRDRWNSVMELFMAGGNYPAAQVPFPQEFAGAVDAEIAAATRLH